MARFTIIIIVFILYTGVLYAQGPIIDVWHGLNQKVGHLGDAQNDFNILGNVSDPDGVASLSYTLNGGSSNTLSIGPDGRRLVSSGDFNIDISYSSLNVGLNTIIISAQDNLANPATPLVVKVDKQTGSYPFDVTIDWSNITDDDPQNVGQYVDGEWGLDNGGLRILRTGYDRIFLIGNKTWQDYEITAQVTINSVNSTTGSNSGKPGLGFIMRWIGHYDGGSPGVPSGIQPKSGFLPFGAIGWFTFSSTTSYKREFFPGDGNKSNRITQGPSISFVPGDTFWMKMRCQTVPSVDGYPATEYKWKYWLDGGTEGPWQIETIQIDTVALRQGGVGLLAHEVDATFGTVTVTEYPDLSLPVSLTSFSAQSSNGHIILNWTTESEVENAGYEILRSDFPDRDLVLIDTYITNQRLIGAINTSSARNYVYVDSSVTTGKTLYYKLVSVSLAGEKEEFGPVSVTVYNSDMVINSEKIIPESIILHQNYPNPFNLSTTIRFRVNSNEAKIGQLSIFNKLGQKIRSLYEGIIPQGQHAIVWDGLDQNGIPVSSGTYYAVMKIGKSNRAIKMNVIK